MRFTPSLSLLGGLAVAFSLTGVAAAQCPAVDSFEENDDCANAVALTAGTYTNLTLEGLAAVAGEDADFYSITVPNGEILQVDCLYLVANGDIDTYLYDAASPTCGDQSSYLARGYTSTDDESFTWSNATGAPATYIIEIDAWDNDTAFVCNDYTLTLSTFPDPCVSAVDDSFEPNDACGSAVALTAGAHTGLFVSDTNPDYYTITVAPADQLTVDLTYASGVNADPELTIFDDLACSNIVSQSFSFGGTGQVLYSNATAAPVTVVLEAMAFAGAGCNNYDLNVAMGPDPCLDPLADDSLEDNDDCASAVQMYDGLTTGLFVSKADEDFYEVTVADLDTLTITAIHSAIAGDIDIYLYDTTVGCGDLASYVARAFTGFDLETLTWTNSTGATQTYYVQVVVWDLSDSDCNTYDLDIVGSGGAFATPFCFGDGSVVACPCLNESALGAGEGCQSSLGYGAILTANGSASVAADDISFTVTQGRPGEPSMLVQGASQIGAPFKDGVLCMGNPTERVEIVFLDAAGEGTSVSSIVTEGGVSPGDTRYYQQWFRDPGGVSPCGNGSNFTNGLIVIYN